MDNDILWVAQSFGFSTSVAQAADIIGIMQTEAHSTRRVGIVELFGAESGFVTANAAHAAGRANLVLIPEMFAAFEDPVEIEAAVLSCVEHVRQHISSMRRGSGVIVIAEGVGELMFQRNVQINGEPASRDRFSYQIANLLKGSLKDQRGSDVGVFVNRPRHHIRAIAPNAFDQTYCDRLGALAVEAGLAGYTKCVVSYWLSEFILVPLSLVSQGSKRLTTTGMFWKQVVLSTGQPDIRPREN
jgi:6-phosphofructokinase 1